MVVEVWFWLGGVGDELGWRLNVLRCRTDGRRKSAAYIAFWPGLASSQAGPRAVQSSRGRGLGLDEASCGCF